MNKKVILDAYVCGIMDERMHVLHEMMDKPLTQYLKMVKPPAQR